jgi:hypothetical protein
MGPFDAAAVASDGRPEGSVCSTGRSGLGRVIIAVRSRATPPTHERFDENLPGNVASGEERFLVEWDRVDDAVWYDIMAFSCPNHVLARLSGRAPAEKRFGRDSAMSLLRMLGLSAVPALG